MCVCVCMCACACVLCMYACVCAVYICVWACGCQPPCGKPGNILLVSINVVDGRPTVRWRSGQGRDPLTLGFQANMCILCMRVYKV